MKDDEFRKPKIPNDAGGLLGIVVVFEPLGKLKSGSDKCLGDAGEGINFEGLL